jgi:putative peptidoglycan lipid II flippase
MTTPRSQAGQTAANRGSGAGSGYGYDEELPPGWPRADEPAEAAEPRDPYAPAESYEPREPYAPSEQYEAREPYMADEPYEARDPYAPPEPYEPHEPYASAQSSPREPYTPSGQYETREPYAPPQPYEAREPYMPGEPHEAREPYASVESSAPREPYAPADPYGERRPRAPGGPGYQPRDADPYRNHIEDASPYRSQPVDADPYQNQTEPAELSPADDYAPADPYGDRRPRAPGGRGYQPRDAEAYRNQNDPAELFPADSQAGDSWPEPDLATEMQAAAVADAPSGGAARHAEPPPPPTTPPREPGSSGGAAQTGGSLARSSGVMAIGTVASRITGFLRTTVLLWALGTHYLGDAYNLANTLPNAVYNLALGGILTSVVVPLLVSAAKRDSGDRGEAYNQRIFTLGVLALGVITILATIAAAPIADLYASHVGSAAAHHLTVVFAYFFIPQIFFYGVSSLAGAILNSRGSFAAPMFTPVINNIVVIVVGGAFVVTAGLNRGANISAAEVGLLGIGTTLGIVLQTAALVPSLRKVGFRWRPRTDFKRAEVSEIGRMGGWMFGYVLTTQIAFLVTTQIANRAGSQVSQQAAGAGFAAYSNAWQLFQLPYAIVGISVITAMLPRMSAHAASRDYDLVSGDFSGATRLASVIVVPAALFLAVLGPPLAEVLFAHGSTSLASARYLGVIFAVFSLGLLPYMLFQLQLRVFYSLHDSRTPALIGVLTMGVNIGTNYAALAVLPAKDVVAGLGAGFGLANLAGTILAWFILSRRLGGLHGRAIGSTLIRMHAASIPPAVFAIAISVMIGVVLPAGMLNALVTCALAGAGGLLLYVMFARAFKVTELAELTESVSGRFRR